MMAETGVDDLPSRNFLAEFVRVQRALLDWKQETLASFATVSLSTIERIERSQSVSAESLDRVAVALGQRRGAFTEPRVPLSAEEAELAFAEAVRPFADRVEVAVRPLRGHRQIAALAKCHFYLVDAGRLGDAYDDDVAVLREWIDLTAFLLGAEEADSVVDLGQREPTQRRRLYGDVLECVRDIERRGHAVALAGTYTAQTESEDLPELKVALVAFFPKLSDPGAIKRRVLLAPAHLDLAAAWHAFRDGIS